VQEVETRPMLMERIPARRSARILAVALLVCFSGVPAALGRVGSFLAELALVLVGALLVLRVAHGWLRSPRQRTAWRLLVALIVLIGFGQIVRNKKLFPLMPYTMYGRAPEAPAKFYQFEAQRRSGARERFRPSRVIASLGRARIVKGLSRELDVMAERGGKGESAERARERVTGMLEALAAYDDRAHASDPWLRIDVIAVELPAPYIPSSARRRTFLTLPLAGAR
jgi:hypothetical protein